MNDNTITIQDLKYKAKQFVDARDWRQFHSPKNISMDIAGEAAELMEFFKWVEGKESYNVLEAKRADVENEVADIAFSLLNFCEQYNIDLSQAFEKKLKITAKNYPIEKAKGCNKKYTEL